MHHDQSVKDQCVSQVFGCQDTPAYALQNHRRMCTPSLDGCMQQGAFGMLNMQIWSVCLQHMFGASQGGANLSLVKVKLHGEQGLADCEPLLLRFDQLLLQQ